jgi:hypothetical protein
MRRHQEEKMKKNNIVTLAILFFSVLIIFVACAKQKPKWKGTIEVVDGITLVKNPKEPIYDNDIFHMEEELNIGEAKGKEEYMFSQIGSIAVDDEERIFVSDWKESHIKVFDKDGNYLMTVGRKGQGPGEFESVTAIQITNQKELMVYDGNSRRISFFSLDGKLLRSQGTSEIQALNFRLNSEGHFLASKVMLDPKNFLAVTELNIYDPDLDEVTNIATSEPNDIFTPFLPFAVWQLTKTDKIVYGNNLTYEFYILDSTGKPLKRIVRNYDPVKITEEEKKESLRRLEQPENKEVPDFHPPYRRFTVDNEDRIFVQTWERPKDSEGYHHDVFDSEGRFITKIIFKFPPQIWKLGKFYSIEEDEDGFQFIKRYKVTWKI